MMHARVKNISNVEPKYRHLLKYAGRLGTVEKRIFENGNLKEYVLIFVNYENAGLMLGSNADIVTIPAELVEVA